MKCICQYVKIESKATPVIASNKNILFALEWV